jgi:glycosyltransferase involved in cell wall biosynthesis
MTSSKDRILNAFETNIGDTLHMKTNVPGLTVILPMYNEGPEVYENLMSVLAVLKDINRSWELIVVDDGSMDNSKSEAKKALGDVPNAKIISYKQNRGRGFALRAGFDQAQGEFIITTESDLSWGAGIIPQLLAAITADSADVVIASPYISGGGLVNTPWKRKFLSYFGNKILTFGLPNISMLSGMTRAYRKSILDKIVLSEDGKEIHLEIMAKLIAIGASIREIPGIITWKKSGDREKKRKRDFKIRNVIMRHIYYSLVESPFHFIGFLGLSFIGIGVIGIIFILVFKMIGFRLINIPYFPLYVFSSLLAGLLIFFFSLLSLQIRDLKREQIRMHSQVIELYKSSKNNK